MSTSNQKINSGNGLDWELKKEKNGIKVYTRDIPDSNLKELKIVMVFEGTSLPKILEVLKNISGYKDWVFNCVESRVVSVLNEHVTVAYYKFDFPWPLSDREIYLEADTKVDSDNKNAVITTKATASYGGDQKNIVRIIEHSNQWEFQEVENNQVNLTYYLKSNPAGNIPDWVVNMAVDKGPSGTLSNLRALVEK